jgi:hypothetical protein
MRAPPPLLSFLAFALLIHVAFTVFTGGPRVEAAFEAGVIVGAGLVLTQQPRG